MTTVLLAELIVPARVGRAGQTAFPLLSMTMHEGLVDQAAKFKKRVASDDTSDYKVVSRGQLVVGFPIDEGVLDFQRLYDAGIVSPAYGVWDLANETTVERAYLQKFLRSPRALRYYKTKLRGSTARRRSLPSEVFLALPVPLPPLPEQRRIAAILDQADELRAKRRSTLTLHDDLTQSIFLDMFGGRPRDITLRDLGVDFSTGKSVAEAGTHPHPRNKIIKVSAISSGIFAGDEAKPLPADYMPPASHRIAHGDILFGRASGSVSLLGATAVVDHEVDDLFLPDKVWRLELPQSDSPLAPFILGVLRSPAFLAYVRHNASGAAGVRNIGKARVLAFEAPNVQPVEQHEFVRRIEAARAVRRIAEADQLDELFASLQSRAFAGRL